jgi:hypothetical protein
VSFAAVTLFVASQRVFIVVAVHFVIDSVRKLLDTVSYIPPGQLCNLTRNPGRTSEGQDWVTEYGSEYLIMCYVINCNSYN